MKTRSTVMSELLEISENSYFRWKKKDHSILIKLLEKYFTKEDLIEFLNTNKINRLEKLNFLNITKEKNRKKYLNSFLVGARYERLGYSHDVFIDFYFSFLLVLREQSYEYFHGLNLLLNKHIVHYNIEHYKVSILEQLQKTYTSFYEDCHLDPKMQDSNKINNFKLTESVIDYLLNNTSSNLTQTLQIHFAIFSNWDDYMFLFLKDVLNDYMFDLYNPKDNEKTQKEALYHIVGYYIYSYYESKLEPSIKISLLVEVFYDLKLEILKDKEALFKKIPDLCLKHLQEMKLNEP